MNKHPVQVVAPIGRDGPLIASLLEKSGLQARVSPNFVKAFTMAERDRLGALLIAEEALTPAAVAHLGELLSTQPGWSDLPVIVLTPGGEETAESIERQQQRLPLGQYSLLERPVRPSTLLSSVQAAIRARKRQFEIRDTIEQRNAALLKLQQSEERLRIATETAHIGTWELDLTTMKLDSSDTCKQNFGRTLDQSLTYSELQAAMHPEDRPGVLEAVKHAITHAELYRAEYRIFWPDGSLHWILASGRVQYSPDQTPLKIIGVTLDISERHLAMDTLLRTEKLAAVGRLPSSSALLDGPRAISVQPRVEHAQILRIEVNMKFKNLAVLYWVFTSVIVFILGIAGVACLFRMDGVPKVIGGLGYPAYVMTFLGLTDLMGVAAVVLPVPKTLREWAYAGFTFNIIAAIFSLLASGHPVVHITDPVIALIAVQGSYLCWRKRRFLAAGWRRGGCAIATASLVL